MRLGKRAIQAGTLLTVLFCAMQGTGQRTTTSKNITINIVDENGAAVPSAEVIVDEPGNAPLHLVTDYRGHVRFEIQGQEPYQLRIQKPGFYQSEMTSLEAKQQDLHLVLTHEQMVVEQVNVSASPPGIDPEQVSDKITMEMPEVVNVPYPTSRDIRNLLPFFPGVVQDSTGQVHVAGSETWATLDTLDDFDIRSPVSGQLAMRFSADAVRSIDQETTRYPVEYGRSTGGVVAFYTGMGDNKFRFNATDFLPSLHDIKGIRFDKVVPRVTFTGPIRRNRAWFFDGLEVEYDDIYIPELPQNANTNQFVRGSNLIRAQVNPGSSNIVSAGLLFNDYHSPYDGLSALVPQQSTTKRDTIAWLPYFRDKQTFHNGALLDLGIGETRFRDGYEPHPGGPFELTPETSLGSYFENLTSESQRVEANAMLYLPPRHWIGRHDLKAGIDLDHIGFFESYRRAPVNYLREDGTLLRQSTFPAITPFTRHNVEVGAYLQDRWTPRAGFLVEPGVRLDWDEIVRRPLLAPRLAAVWAPPGKSGATKISAGVGLYYEHTQLEYLARSLAGIRYDTYFAPDGITPATPPLESQFTFNQGSLKEAYAINWSVGLEQRLPGAVYLKANYIHKTVEHEFTYLNESAPAGLSGIYTLTNAREDHDRVEEIEARHTFSGNYALFGAYTHSTARTNAAIDYVPAISRLGPQQPGPLGWDTPNRIISWGWLPFLLPYFRKNWDLVYTVDWHTGFPFTAINANHQVVGAANAQRFPTFKSYSPGLEWRFHLHGLYLGLRGVMENATNSGNFLVVNNDVDSPEYRTFSEPLGRAFTARIRLIESNR
jgi:hypothetical protein